jgi:hypothetical protein
MLGSRRTPVKQAALRPGDALRGRLLVAIAAGAGLVQACGGRAQDVADEDSDLELGRAGSSARAPSGSNRTGSAGSGSSTGRAGTPATPPPTMPAAREPARRDGEICYSPNQIADATGVGSLLEFLPADAFDDNGCLASDYTQWLDGGACNYDPRPAVVRGDQCCHLLDSPIPGCGRPFVVGDTARTAPVRSSLGWTDAAIASAPHRLSPSLAREIGQEWLADARLEHASVAAFASLSLSLLAVGAPPQLLAACQRAGLDEVEHARACFALASRFSGVTLGPGPLSLSGVEIETDLEALVLRTWLDGCVEETIAALAATAQLAGARDEAVRATLSRIADDEARHAELAWSFVAWALASGAPGLRRTLLAARDRLEASGIGAPHATAAPHDGALTDEAALAERHAHGRLSAAELRSLRASAWRDVIRPALDALLEATRPPASLPSHGASLGS